MDETFTTWDFQKKLGIKRDRLKEWLARGYIKPSVQQSAGVGSKNIFSRWDAYMIHLLDNLLMLGISRMTAGQVIGAISQQQIIWKNEHSIPLKIVKAGAALKVSLSKGFTFKGEDYIYIVYVNFDKIREEVDQLLA